jgi:hypothetical protein
MAKDAYNILATDRKEVGLSSCNNVVWCYDKRAWWAPPPPSPLQVAPNMGQGGAQQGVGGGRRIRGWFRHKSVRDTQKCHQKQVDALIFYYKITYSMYKNSSIYIILRRFVSDRWIYKKAYLLQAISSYICLRWRGNYTSSAIWCLMFSKNIQYEIISLVCTARSRILSYHVLKGT